MNLPRKSGPAQTLRLLGDVPDMPSVPEEMTKRFPEMQDYENAMQQWWASFQLLNQRDRAEVMAQSTQSGDTADTFAKIDTQLAILQLSISQLQPTSTDVRKLADAVSSFAVNVRQVIKERR